MHITISLASNVTNELVTGWCITEWVKRLAGDEIELGMKIPTIESRASNILIDKGNNVWCYNDSTDKNLRRICRSQYEHPGSAIGYWPEMSLGHIYIVLKSVGSASLMLVDDRYYEFMCFDVPKVVQSPGWDQGHDEESRNGWDIKIDILEGYVWTSERFRESSSIYRSTGGLPEPPGESMGLNGPFCIMLLYR